MLAPNKTNPPDEVVCLKRPWVMLTLSDDEALAPGAELPRGLRLHLSRCASCRSIAEKLMAVTDGLAGVAATAEPDDLFDRASARARTALRGGADLTGRVDIEEESVDVWSVGPEVRYAQRRTVLRWVAVAACIGLVAASAVVWRVGPGSSRASHGVASSEWELPASPVGRDRTTTRDFVGPVRQANPTLELIGDHDAADVPNVYVLAPEPPDPAERRRTAMRASSSSNRSVKPPADRLLDNPRTALSTVNTTKDR